MKKLAATIFSTVLFLMPVAYTHAALLTNLANYWKFDESSGNAVDSTGNANAINNGSVTYGPGKINNGAVISNGANYTTSTANISTNSFSFSVWLFPTTENVQQNTIVRNAGGGTGVIFRIDNGAGHILAFAGGTTLITSNYSLPLNTWTHVVWTASPSGSIIYINGTVDNTSANVATIDTSNMNIGLGGGGEYFQGTIDELGLWSRTLTQAEVTQLYNSGNGLQYPFILVPKFNFWQMLDF